MLVLFSGSDRSAVRDRAEEYLLKDSRRIFRLSAPENSIEEVLALVSAQSLFAESYSVVLSNFLSEEESDEAFEHLLPDLASSVHTFVLIEDVLPAALERKVRANAAEVFAIKGNAKNGAPAFNVFSITDAVAARDRKRAWVLYQNALLTGLAAEEIFWRVVWQVKVLLLARQTKTAEEAELKPFVFSKAKNASANYGEVELGALSRKLLTLYHRARLGEQEFETGLEKILLSL